MVRTFNLLLPRNIIFLELDMHAFLLGLSLDLITLDRDLKLYILVLTFK